MPEFNKEQEPDEAKEEEMREIGDKMDEDQDIGTEFKDQLIPLALEYYMGVIEEDSDADDNPDSDDPDSDDLKDKQPKCCKGKPKRGAKKGGDDCCKKDGKD